ncbi:MAG: hypothetical protein KBF73_03955 [Flavobacteriales bacterium]|nr:hypothetical protein [Flavobacteriales bacterium]
MADFVTNYGIIAAYILLAIAAFGAIGFPILDMIKNPKGTKGALIGVGIIVLIFGISYALGSDENPSKIKISGGTAKLVDTGLYSFYILSLIAIVVTIYSEVSKVFK